LKSSLRVIYNLNFVRAIVVPSEKVKEDFLLHFSLREINKLKVIPNPIDTQALDGAENNKEIFFKNDFPLVLSMQRFEQEKDNFTLIKSIKETLKTRNVNFLLLGEGSQEKELKRLVSELDIEENVILPGFYPDPFPILKKADVFVLSSFAEGMPNSLLQALYFNLPVIATDCNFGPSEILEGGKWGSLIEIGDYLTMSQEIIKALDGKLKIMPREIFQRTYSAKHIAKQYLKLHE
jgi:glycosyltransferase involved in cell wall biosynthesis